MSALSDTLDYTNESEIHALFDTLEEGVMVWSKDRTLVFANEASRRITKLNLTHGTPLIAPTERMTIRIVNNHQEQADMDALPVYRAFRGENVPYEEMRYIDPSGKHRWLAVSAQRILDERGQLRYVVSSVRDISLRKSREHKLEFMVESAKILSLNLDFEHRLIEKAKLTVPNLADRCSMDVLQTDGARRVITVHEDERMVELLNSLDEKYPRDAILHIIQKQHPVFIPDVTEERLQTLATSPEHLEDLRTLGLKSLMIIPIVSRGEGVGAMTLAYSQSGRMYDESDFEFFQEFCYHIAVVFDNARLFDEIETRDKSKDIFLAALSHELRNPLAPIKSSLELLKMQHIPDQISEELDIIEHQFDHMSHLLNDLLDVTRFTQNRIALSARPVDLRRLIERALRATDGVMRQSAITLHYAYPSAPISVIADETRLEQAVSNLISNAVKFTPTGGSIWVDLERDADTAVIRVRDNGTGIAAEDLPRIFDMYYQGQNKGPVNSGLGIGLLLVQRIITLHNGTVEAKSDGRGTGSEFIVRLPTAAVDVPEQPAVKPRSLAQSLRIIVVDDNAPAADSLVRLLNKLGANAKAVYSGHEALGSEQLHMIDLFLLDIGMPQMDGYELVSALRRRGISAPIVALTGYGLADDKQRANVAGFTSHLTKPVGLTELNALFEHVLVVST